MTVLKRQTIYRTYNVTMRRLHTTIVAVEKQQVLHILSVYVEIKCQLDATEVFIADLCI